MFNRLSRWRRPRNPEPWRKVDLIHALVDIHGFRSLLEISTAETAGSFVHFDRSRFERCLRLSYLTPENWTDGAPIDYRCEGLDTTDGIRAIREAGLTFDIVFVDAWHEPETAERDFIDALSLVRPGGVLMAHDCLPDDAEASGPRREGRYTWYGVSYKIYVDSLLKSPDLVFCTVDIDCGCGIVRRGGPYGLYRRAADGGPELMRAWRSLGADYDAAYSLFARHREALMNVVNIDDFLAGERVARRFAAIGSR